MSAMYELLDSFIDSYEAEKSEADVHLLQQAVDRLSEALEERLHLRIAGLREASAMSRKLGDEPLSLVFDFYLGHELIGVANDMVEGVAVVRPAAIASRAREYDHQAQRIGLNNMLASAYTLIDPLGYADEIEMIGRLVEDSPLTDNEDLCIGLGATYQVHLARGDVEAAMETRNEIWAHARALDDPLYYLHATTYDTELAFERGDWQAMVDAAEACWKMVEHADGSGGIDVVLQRKPETLGEFAAGHDEVRRQQNLDEEEERDPLEPDIESDADYMVVVAAQACGLAKLGRGDEIVGSETSNLGSEQPASYNFFLFWVECHIAMGKFEVAASLAEAAWEELSGKGQYYRETQMICLIIRALSTAGRLEDIDPWVRKAREVACHLREPACMLHQIETACGATE